MAQQNLIKKSRSHYGGSLQTTRKGRQGSRPLATRQTMHVVLRSSLAFGPWSFKKRENERQIKKIVDKFAMKYGVTILSIANVGNHIHIHIKLSNLFTFKPFIRAITSAIMMAVTGASRWQPLKSLDRWVKLDQMGYIRKASRGFWDYRPFTRIIQAYRDLLNLKDYIQINQLEGFGVDRDKARYLVRRARFVGNTS